MTSNVAVACLNLLVLRQRLVGWKINVTVETFFPGCCNAVSVVKVDMISVSVDTYFNRTKFALYNVFYCSLALVTFAVPRKI